jgi:hypothetical protein
MGTSGRHPERRLPLVCRPGVNGLFCVHVPDVALVAALAVAVTHCVLEMALGAGAPHLFRTGQLPSLRGTSVQLDPNARLLYTRGSIPYFRTYRGMYVPQP